MLKKKITSLLCAGALALSLGANAAPISALAANEQNQTPAYSSTLSNASEYASQTQSHLHQLLMGFSQILSM